MDSPRGALDSVCHRVRALRGDVTGHFLIVQLVLQEHLRVAAHGHQVGGDAHNGVDGADSASIRSVSEHEILPLPMNCGLMMTA